MEILIDKVNQVDQAVEEDLILNQHYLEVQEHQDKVIQEDLDQVILQQVEEVEVEELLLLEHQDLVLVEDLEEQDQLIQFQIHQ